jgi:formylglycine-generating enzyme required for sulfatase activity
MKAWRNITITAITVSVLTACHADSPAFPLTQNQLVKSVLNDMVFVKGGTFAMGQNPNAQVTLTGYYMDKYDVPYYQYKSYLVLQGQQVNQTIGDKLPINNGMYPAWINYQQASSFCQWLSQKTNLPFALPTEAQWEYAARSRGQNVQYSTDDGTLKPGINLPNYQDFLGNINGYTSISYVKVNAFPPNPLGMYLMNGNSAEWTQNWYGPLPNSPEKNPTGPASGIYKVVRGTDISDIMDSFDPRNSPDEQAYHKTALSVYNRSWAPAGGKYPALLFRCVINSDKPLPKL